MTTGKGLEGLASLQPSPLSPSTKQPLLTWSALSVGAMKTMNGDSSAVRMIFSVCST